MANPMATSEAEYVRASTQPLGRVFDIQRFSLHDGPGIRTTVFLKGCPLRCLWCHNPEGISASPEVSFLPEKCMACGECVRACPNGAHRLERSAPEASAVTHLYDRDSCKLCGQCAQTCDTGTLEFVGRWMNVDEVMKEVIQDRPFYASSSGGLTVSGGEPLSQIDFTLALLRAAREQGIHRSVETSGFASWERFRALLPWVNLFLFDCKDTNAQKHKDFTGQTNSLILENLRALHAEGAKVQLQCPIVPGFNDREDHFSGIVSLVQSLPRLEGIRLLPYHPLGKSKLGRFGLGAASWLPKEPLDPSVLDYWTKWLIDRGVRVLNADSSQARASGP